MRRRQRWVLVLVALLGIAGGVTTAFLAPGASDSGPTAGGEVNDPLRLGVPQVSLPSCTGESVLVLGTGNTAASLTPAVIDAGDGVRYLRTDESCPTLWSEDDEVPSYVVYSGPYESAAQPCADSLDGADASTAVTNLNSGNATFVTCACVLPMTELQGIVPPGKLAEGEEPAGASWVRMLQRMLADLDAGGPGEPIDVTGVYDRPTIDRVRQLQEDNGILPADGRVGERTWAALRDQPCGNYDF
jgi:hypothetical protein